MSEGRSQYDQNVDRTIANEILHLFGVSPVSILKFSVEFDVKTGLTFSTTRTALNGDLSRAIELLTDRRNREAAKQES